MVVGNVMSDESSAITKPIQSALVHPYGFVNLPIQCDEENTIERK